jgi:hypothetical protein
MAAQTFATPRKRAPATPGGATPAFTVAATPLPPGDYPKAGSVEARSLVHSLFRLPKTDVLYGDFGCTLQVESEESSVVETSQGRLYITSSSLCFFAEGELSGLPPVRKVVPFKYVSSIAAHRVTWVLPAIDVRVAHRSGNRRYVLFAFFGTGRDEALKLCRLLHQQHCPEMYVDPVGTPDRVRFRSESLSSVEDAPPKRARANTTPLITADAEVLAEIESEFTAGSCVVDGPLHISPEDYWHEFLGDDAAFGALDVYRAAGHTEVSVAPWTERLPPSSTSGTVEGAVSPTQVAQRGFASSSSRLLGIPRLVRHNRYRKVIHGVLMVPSTRVEQTQTLWRVGNAEGRVYLVCDTVSRSLDVPYGDTFAVIERLVVSPVPDDGQCRVRVGVLVSFQKRGLLSSRIESAAIAGVTADLGAWMDRLRAHLARFRGLRSEGQEASGERGIQLKDLLRPSDLTAAEDPGIEQQAASGYCSRCCPAVSSSDAKLVRKAPGPQTMGSANPETVMAAYGAMWRTSRRAVPLEQIVTSIRVWTVILLLSSVLAVGLVSGYWVGETAEPRSSERMPDVSIQELAVELRIIASSSYWSGMWAGLGLGAAIGVIGWLVQMSLGR